MNWSPKQMSSPPVRVVSLVLLTGMVLLMSGCTPSGSYSGPDMEPIGSGLRFIGIGLVVMALVFVLSGRR